MAGFQTRRARMLIALGLGLLATGALYVPPFNLGPRADRALYDYWLRASPPSAPDEILLVRLDDPAWFTTLAAIARGYGTRSLITTLPQPPSPIANELALGPTEFALSDTLLRRTDWMQGGHLWFRPEFDGIVRQDWSVIDDTTPIRSLALAAAISLWPDPEHEDTPDAAQATATPAFSTDASGRRWLRFYAPDTFTELKPADLLAAPQLLRDKIVIAGASTSNYTTPLGSMHAPALLAQAVAGYWQDSAIRATIYTDLGVWIAALLVLGWLMLGRPRSITERRVAPLAAAGGLITANAIGFLGMELWLPLAGPMTLLLVAGGVSAFQPRHRQRKHIDVSPVAARRLAASGCSEEAWKIYRNLPTTSPLLAELYALGDALESQGSAEYAADVFHRIAQTDASYRDVTRRLAINGQTTDPTVTDIDPVLVPADMPDSLGRYELLEQIGYGGAGQVFLGRDPKINRIVAIKVINLSAEFGADELCDASDRFRREAETAGRLNHPNIVTVFDIGETNGLAYIAMEYLKGRRFSEYCEPETLLPAALVLELLARTADALHYAHEQNVVHRDIKPANIMYDSVSDSLKITDFGIARLIDVSRTRTGIVLGTPSFMAPEQLEGKNVNGHTDLFALGVSLYQLLTGQLPFRGSSMTKLMFVIANEPHKPVTALRTGLPEQLNPLFDTALAKNPADRFHSGADMADALRAVAAQVA